MLFPSLKIPSDEIARAVGSPRHCAHERKELRKKIDATGRPRLHYQCLVCGLPVGNRVSAKHHSAEQIESLLIFDDTLRSAYWHDYNERYQAERNARLEQLKERWKEAYSDYRKSTEWIAKRKLVIQRAQGICEGCRLSRAVEAHHTTYDDVGEEFLFELVAVCRSCHDRFHKEIFPRFLERLYYSGCGRELEPCDDEPFF